MSESDIDMDRCLLGIDDEKACVPEITWTNCAEKMPPDDLDIIIDTWTGHKFKSVGWILKHEVNAFGLANFKWTPYTPEKWEELKND